MWKQVFSQPFKKPSYPQPDTLTYAIHMFRDQDNVVYDVMTDIMGEGKTGVFFQVEYMVRQPGGDLLDTAITYDGDSLKPDTLYKIRYLHGTPRTRGIVYHSATGQMCHAIWVDDYKNAYFEPGERTWNDDFVEGKEE